MISKALYRHMKYFAGNKFYDNQDVFARYVHHRKWAQNPNEIIEKPIIFELINEISGTVLDLGCGYGDIATELLAKGIDHYTGIDASLKMISLGKSQINHPKITLHQADIETYKYAKSEYDWVLARLVFHYINKLEELLNNVYNCLKKNGSLVFSVEHPILTSSMDFPREAGKKKDWTVDQYFNSGIRNQDWLGNKVIKYHRIIEEYWHIVNEAGFRIEMIKEGKPNEKYFQTIEEYQRRKRIPLFLVIKATKL